CASLVSAGTERSASEFASLSLVGKAARRPDLVRRVLEKVRRDGIWETQRAVRSRLQTAEPLGYSCAGIVEEDGTGEHPVGAPVAAERTHRRGVDSASLAATGKDAAAASGAAEVSRGRGRIVVLGDIRLDLEWRVFY